MTKIFTIISIVMVSLYIVLTIADKIRCANIDKKRKLENDNSL